MLLMKKREIRINCDICVVKACCNNICKEEYTLVRPIIMTKISNFLNSMYSNHNKAFKYNALLLSDILHDHFIYNKFCPVCGNIFCYYLKQENITQICCSYCRVPTRFVKTIEKKKPWTLFLISSLSLQNFSKRSVTFKELFKTIKVSEYVDG